MTKDVGILTLFDAFNYGAFLQAYAMQKTLRHLGFEPVFFRENGVSKRYFLNILKHRKAWWKLYGVRNYMILKKSWEKLAVSSSQPSATLDAIIVGSDEVWSIRNDQFTHLPSHFSIGLNAKKTIAYGPSFGSTQLEDVQDNQQVKDGLQGFTSISARDTNTQHIIRALTGRDAPIVCDPTFLVDLDESNLPDAPKNYIFVYFLGNDPEFARKITAFAKQVNKPLICAGIGNFHFWCDKFILANPFEFLTLIKNADAVVSNTFHGTILSLKYQRQLLSFTKSRPKVRMALEMYNLQDRECSDADMEAVLNKPIDFPAINALIAQQKKDSLDYLANALKE